MPYLFFSFLLWSYTIFQVKTSAIAKVAEKCKAIAKEIVDYLNTVKGDLFVWKESELPESRDMTCIAAKATELIRNKINSAIHEWRLQRSSEINTEIENILRSQFQIIEDDIRIVDDCFGSLAGYSSNYMPLWNVLSSLTTYCHLGTGVAIVSLPVLFFDLKWIFVILGEIPFAYVYDLKNKSLMKKYDSGKKVCMKEWAEITLKKEITEAKVYTLMKPFMQNMIDKIRHICETVVPKRIRADKMCINDVIIETRSELEILRQYNPIQRYCEMIIGKIEILCMEYFPMFPFSFQFIQHAQVQDQIGSGSFSIVHSAIISIKNEDIVAAVKTSKSPLGDDPSYQEVSEAVVLRFVNLKY